MLEDHYTILGVDPNASEDEIKKAYRKIAIKRHPDKSKIKGDDIIFREATQAYEILKDPQKRRSYDASRKKVKVSPKRIRKGTNLKVSIDVITEDLIKGRVQGIITIRKALCPKCAGTGLKKGKLPPCPTCRGSGIDLVSSVIGPRKYCSTCKGYGDITGNGDCPECHGLGLYEEKVQRMIRLHPTIGHEVTLPGAGNFIQGGGEAGDLIVEINVPRDRECYIQGLDIKKVIQISPPQAVLGDVITLGLYGKKRQITIPPGTQHGSLIEDRYGGINWNNSTGSLIVRVLVNVPGPSSLSKEEITLYSKLLKASKGIL